MRWKLICVDIDGTLLDDRKRLPQDAADSLRKAAETGIAVALISGRMPAAVEMIEKELGFPCIKACSAGTYILMGDRCISAAYLPISVMEEIDREIAKERGVPLWIYREREWYVTKMDDVVRRETEIIGRNPIVADAGQLARQWRQEGKGPNKLLFGAGEETIRQIVRQLREKNQGQADFACSAPTYLEIYPKGVHKGQALRAICRELGIREEETIAFGDQELDIPMIEAAGAGVAMGNAIPALKERADFITKTNNEGGIAFGLEHFLKDED